MNSIPLPKGTTHKTFMLSKNLKKWKDTALIGLGLLVIWELLAYSVFKGRFVVPAPTSVVATAFRDGFYFKDLLRTLSEASLGWLLGNGLALMLAAIVLVAPKMESALLSLGVMSYAIPTVAIGPILFILQDPFSAKVTMSALSVFFVTLIAAVTGLRAASKTSLELVSVFGGGKWDMLSRVRIRAAVPHLASGLCISAPAAILGAVIGDYFGGQSGLGVIMLQAQEQLSVSRTWAVALVTTAISGAAYALTSLVAKSLGAWSSTGTESSLPAQSDLNGAYSPRFMIPLKSAKQVAVALIIWYSVVKLSGLGGYFLKTPQAVWEYLISGHDASTHLEVVMGSVATTLLHAGMGWVLGSIVAIVGAVALSTSPAASKAIMPLILVIRSVPLVAMTPLIALMLGRGLVGITSISALVTLVPSIVTISDGLKLAPPAAIDIVNSAGGSRLQALIRIQAFYGVPSLFAAAKISMPGAILGAVLAEWLVARNGIGHAMAYDVVGSNFANLWASIVSIAIVSLILYTIVNASEKASHSRLSI